MSGKWKHKKAAVQRRVEDQLHNIHRQRDALVSQLTTTLARVHTVTQQSEDAAQSLLGETDRTRFLHRVTSTMTILEEANSTLFLLSTNTDDSDDSDSDTQLESFGDTPATWDFSRECTPQLESSRRSTQPAARSGARSALQYDLTHSDPILSGACDRLITHKTEELISETSTPAVEGSVKIKPKVSVERASADAGGSTSSACESLFLNQISEPQPLSLQSDLQIDCSVVNSAAPECAIHVDCSTKGSDASPVDQRSHSSDVENESHNSPKLVTTELLHSSESLPHSPQETTKISSPAPVTQADETTLHALVMPADETTPHEPVTPAHETTPHEPVTPAHETTPHEPVTPAHETTPREPVTPAHETTPHPLVTPAHETTPHPLVTPADGVESGGIFTDSTASCQPSTVCPTSLTKPDASSNTDSVLFYSPPPTPGVQTPDTVDSECTVTEVSPAAALADNRHSPVATTDEVDSGRVSTPHLDTTVTNSTPVLASLSSCSTSSTTSSLCVSVSQKTDQHKRIKLKKNRPHSNSSTAMKSACSATSSAVDYSNYGKGPEVGRLQLKEGDTLDVFVVEVLRPSLFWVQPQTSQVDDLVDGLTLYQQRLKAGDAGYQLEAEPQIGMLVCAFFSSDKNWYRGRITAIYNTPRTDSAGERCEVEVFYIDFGNTAALQRDSLRPLPAQFARLPAQAFMCALHQVGPPVNSVVWRDDVSISFAQMVVTKCYPTTFRTVPDCPVIFAELMLAQSLPVLYPPAHAQTSLVHELQGLSNILIKANLGRTVDNLDLWNNVIRPQLDVYEHFAQSYPDTKERMPTITNIQLQMPSFSDGRIQSFSPASSEARDCAAAVDSSFSHKDTDHSVSHSCINPESAAKKASMKSISQPDIIAKSKPEDGRPSEQDTKETKDGKLTSSSQDTKKIQDGKLNSSSQDIKETQDGKLTSSSQATKKIQDGKLISSSQITKTIQDGKLNSSSQDTKETQYGKLTSSSQDTKKIQDGKLNSSSQDTKKTPNGKLTSSSQDTKEIQDGKLTSSSSSSWMRETASNSLEEELEQVLGARGCKDKTQEQDGAAEEAAIVDGNPLPCDQSYSTQASGSRQRLLNLGLPTQFPSDCCHANTYNKWVEGADVEEEISVELKAASSQSSGSHRQSLVTESGDCADLACPPSIDLASITVEQEFRQQKLQVPDDRCLQVMMSHIDSPGQFWVHLVTEEAQEIITNLREELNAFYRRTNQVAMQRYFKCRDLKLHTICCAQYCDEEFYRAEIIRIRYEVVESDSVKAGAGGDGESFPKRISQVQVFYVDFGNCEWVTLADIYPLPLKLADIPPQAIPCKLANLSPKAPSTATDGVLRDTSAPSSKPGKWMKSAKVTFKELTGYQHQLVAYAVTCQPGQEISPTAENPLQLVVVDTAGACDVWVNEELVRHGWATSHGLTSIEAIQQQKDADVPESNDFPMRWDPMAADYLSERNTYNMDVDDPSVAVLGYKPADEKRICYHFQRNGRCMRGNKCRFEHIRTSDITSDQRAVYFLCDPESVVSPPGEKSWVVVELTAIINPGHFYVTFPFGTRHILELIREEVTTPDEGYEGSSVSLLDSIDALMEALTEVYRHKPRRDTDLAIYAIGEIVVARFSEDDRWYRARITDSDPDNSRVEVFYVDFGNVEWSSESNIRQMQPQFMHLPFQAVETFLPVEPMNNQDGWSTLAREWFSSQVEGKVLVANVLTKNPQYITILLYDGDFNIREELVSLQLACRQPLPFSRASSTTSSGSSPCRPRILPG